MSDVMITPTLSTVQNAYGKAQSFAISTPQDKTVSQDFGALVENAAQKAVTTVRQGDQVASAGLAGQADIQAVVEATMAMENTVRVSVALRDKMVEAYQEIMRMPI